MNLLLDTNIVINIIRSKDIGGIVKFINPSDEPLYLSIVSEGEIKSFAIRNKWGDKRQYILDAFLDQINIIDINPLYTSVYAEIDCYSQRSNPNFENYPFNTPRNMGKNDLWIASLGALLGLKLITTDADFDHLNGVFVEVKKISPNNFLPFL